MNVSPGVISVCTSLNYITVLVNAKNCVNFPVTVFQVKEYKLDRIGKKQMPICRICDPPYGFTNWMEFNADQVCRHGGKDKYTCHYEGCTKEFKSLSGFQNHIFFHEEDKKRWQCKTYKLEFTYESQLDRHQSTHTDSKPCKCASKTCPKFKEGFKSQQSLDRHMDIHKGNCIKCDVQGCPKTFTTSYYLRDHKNMAHGLPYGVQTCIRCLHFYM